MRRLTALVAVVAAALALLTGVAMARARTLAVLITIQRPIRDGVDWQVLGPNGKVLGGASEACNKKDTVCRFDFKLPHGSLRTTWYFTRRRRTSVRTGAEVTGGSGQYAGATGHASVDAVGPGGTVSPILSGAQFIQVVFHLS